MNPWASSTVVRQSHAVVKRTSRPSRLWVLTLAAAGLASAAPPPLTELQQVTPSVYAALQPTADRFNDSNSIVIVLDDCVVIVDTQTTLGATRAVLEQVRKLTIKPVRYVINTHWHGDHVQGNQVYREAFPNVQFIAQTSTREDMQTRTAAELKQDLAEMPGRIERAKKMLASGQAPDGSPLTEAQKRTLQMRVDVFSSRLPDLRHIHIVLPDITFDDELAIHSGGREIRLMHYLGHTRGDVVAYLPAEKILISGDLLDDMPFTGDGSPARLVETLRALDKLDFQTVIPGHGGIKNGHDHLRLVAGLFESIVTQVHAAVQEKLSLDETKKRVNVKSFREPITHGEEHALNAFEGFVPAAVERAYAEETGTLKNE